MAFIKWLRILAYVAIISLINSVVDYLTFVPASISTWVSRGIMAATIYCMFNLSRENNRYKKAAIFRTVFLGCALITSLLFGSYLLSIAASICSIVAVYQEYAAHSEVVAEKDMALSRKWRNLFYWEFIAAILLSLGSSVAAVILMSYELPVNASRVSSIVILLLNIPQFFIQLVRLQYLNKMISLFLTDE